MLAKIYVLSDYEYVFYSFVFHRTLIDDSLISFTVSALPFPTAAMHNCKTFGHLISEIGPYPCVAPGFYWRPKWELFPVNVASGSTAATSSANKSFEELFFDRVKPNPTKKDKGKSKRVSTRAHARKLLPIKCNVEITKNISC